MLSLKTIEEFTNAIDNLRYNLNITIINLFMVCN